MATTATSIGDMLKKDGLMTKLVLHNVPTRLTRPELIELLTDIAGTPLTLYIHDVVKDKPKANFTWALLVVQNISATGRIFKKLHNIPPYNMEVQAMSEWYSERWSRISLDDMYGSDKVHEASNAVQGMFKDLDHKLQIAKDILVITAGDDGPDKSKVTLNIMTCVACDGSPNLECQQCKAMFCSEQCFNENWSWHKKFCCPSPKSSHSEPQDVQVVKKTTPLGLSQALNKPITPVPSQAPLLKTPDIPPQQSLINRREFAKVWQNNRGPQETNIKQEPELKQITPEPQARDSPREKEEQKVVRSPEAKFNSQQVKPAERFSQERQTHENYQSNQGGYDPRRFNNQEQQNNRGGRGEQSGRNNSEQRTSQENSQGGWNSDYARDDQSKDKSQGGWKQVNRLEQGNSGYGQQDGDGVHTNQQRGWNSNRDGEQFKERGQGGFKQGNRPEQGNSGYARDGQRDGDRAHTNQQRGWNGNRAEQGSSNYTRDRQQGDDQYKEKPRYPQQGGEKATRPEQRNSDRSRDSGDQSKENPRYFQQYEPQTTRQMSWKGGQRREGTQTDGVAKVKSPPANFVPPFNLSSVALKNLLAEQENKLGESCEEKTKPTPVKTEPRDTSTLQDNQVVKQEQVTELTNLVADSAHQVVKFLLEDIAWELLGDPGCELNVTVTWVLTEDLLVVSKCDNNFAKLFEQLPINIANFIASHKKPLDYIPELSELVLAPFEGAYYRGIIASITEEKAKVSFLEYGNIESIPVKDLFPVSAIIGCVPSVSHNVYVDLLMPNKSSELSAEQKKLLKSLLKVDTTHHAVILAVLEDKCVLHFPDVTEAVQKLAEN